MPRFASSVSALALVAATVGLSGSLTACTQSAGEVSGVDVAAIELGQNDTGSTEQTGPEPSFLSTIDPRADLDIEDQRGDGSSVLIDSVRVTRDGVYLVIMDDDGIVLGSTPTPPGVQPVQVDLDRPITQSGYYLGLLLLDDGDGIVDPNVDLPLRDDDDDIVDEDFEYYLN